LKYNLIILHSESGSNLATIKLSETGIDEDEGILMSGVVKAIENLLHELRMGQIHSFITYEKKILTYKHERILVALICDKNDNIELCLPKIKYVAKLFYEHVDWSVWNGEIHIFNDIIELVKKIFILSDDETISNIDDSLMKIINNFPDIYGYRIYYNHKKVKEYFRESEDFELIVFLKSKMIDTFIQTRNKIAEITKNFLSSDEMQLVFMDYDRFSIYVYNIAVNFEILLYLPGKTDPITDIEKFNKKFQEVSEFYGL
jgi:hypothetical protein